MRWRLALIGPLAAAPLAAEVIPEPSSANPRIQTVQWQAGEPIQLTALPATGLTLLFEPGEAIASVDADPAMVAARIAHERNALQLMPLRDGSLGRMQVTTARRSYNFSLRTGNDLMAAYLVRFVSGPATELPPAPAMMAQPAFPRLQPPPMAMRGPASWGYRLKGDKAVRPADISDDGIRTIILFPDGAALPAVFAIGASGDEQVVNGYMRGGQFVIDEVWQELVFRIDGSKANARRNPSPDDKRG